MLEAVGFAEADGEEPGPGIGLSARFLLAWV